MSMRARTIRIPGLIMAAGSGFSLGALVETSTLGSDVRFFGRGVGAAVTPTEGSKSVGEAASCARTNCDAPNATLLHTTERNIPL